MKKKTKKTYPKATTVRVPGRYLCRVDELKEKLNDLKGTRHFEMERALIPTDDFTQAHILRWALYLGIESLESKCQKALEEMKENK